MLIIKQQEAEDALKLGFPSLTSQPIYEASSADMSRDRPV